MKKRKAPKVIAGARGLFVKDGVTHGYAVGVSVVANYANISFGTVRVVKGLVEKFTELQECELQILDPATNEIIHKLDLKDYKPYITANDGLFTCQIPLKVDKEKDEDN